MKLRLCAMLLVAATLHGERILLKNNTVQTGRLTGIEGGNLLVESQAGLQRIPLSGISAIIFEDTGNLVPAGVGTGTAILSPVTPVASANVLVIENLRVELDRCVKQASAVTCHFRMTNLAADRQIGILSSRSSYVDAAGNERVAQSAVLGTSQVRGEATSTAVTNVTVRASLIFPGVDPGVNSLAKLSMTVRAAGRFVPAVEFRNIPLQGN